MVFRLLNAWVCRPSSQAAVVVMFLSLFPIRHAYSEAKVGFTDVGGYLGLVDPEDTGSTLGLGVTASFGTVLPGLHWTGELGYWSKSHEAGSLSDFSIATSLNYHFSIGSESLTPFAGGGLGLHVFHAETDVGFARANESETELGLHLQGGIVAPIGPSWNVVGLMRLVASEVDQVQLLVGAEYLL